MGRYSPDDGDIILHPQYDSGYTRYDLSIKQIVESINDCNYPIDADNVYVDDNGKKIPIVDYIRLHGGTEKKISKYKANDREWLAEKNAPQFVSVEEWDKYMAELANPNGQTGAGTTGATINDLVKDDATPVYADEILPFDITITFANEYGAKATTVLYGVELLNEGIGFSIDSTTTERAYTFVCRSVDTMKAVDDDHAGNISTTW